MKTITTYIAADGRQTDAENAHTIFHVEIDDSGRVTRDSIGYGPKHPKSNSEKPASPTPA